MSAPPFCLRCGRDTHVESLGVSSGSRWLHCDRCGHVWRQVDLERDTFALLVASHRAFDRPSVEHSGRQAIPRAARFNARLEIRHRSLQDPDWQVGHTENLSRTGVLFRTETPLEQDAALELIIVLPSGVSDEAIMRFRCHGEIVRRQPSTRAGEASAIAAAVDGYRLTLQ